MGQKEREGGGGGEGDKRCRLKERWERKKDGERHREGASEGGRVIERERKKQEGMCPV